jgi:hypothetical protein
LINISNQIGNRKRLNSLIYDGYNDNYGQDVDETEYYGHEPSSSTRQTAEVFAVDVEIRTRT